MQNACIVILSMLAILSFHESEHYIAARLMHCKIQDSQMELRVNQIINELKENYFLSDVWYIHFITWGIVVACKLFNI